MYFPDLEADKKYAAEWAASLLACTDWVILDTETTGLGGDAEIVQITVVDHQGKPLLDTLVKPQGVIEKAAFEVHRISEQMLENAPLFPQVYELLVEILRNRLVIIFNATFDHRMLWQSCQLHKIEFEAFEHNCAMLMYSQWIGEYNTRRDRPGSFKWQRLPGGDHSALGDCKATLEVLRQMAASLKVAVVK